MLSFFCYFLLFWTYKRCSRICLFFFFDSLMSLTTSYLYFYRNSLLVRGPTCSSTYSIDFSSSVLLWVLRADVTVTFVGVIGIWLSYEDMKLSYVIWSCCSRSTASWISCQANAFLSISSSFWIFFLYNGGYCYCCCSSEELITPPPAWICGVWFGVCSS